MKARMRAASVAFTVGMLGLGAAGLAPMASATTYSCSSTHISGNIWVAGYYSGNTVVPSSTSVSAAGKEAQCILLKRNYNPGTIDGIFGPSSRKALMALQADANGSGAGLTVDGSCGPKTWPYLRVNDWG